MSKIKIISDEEYNRRYKIPFSMKLYPVYWMMNAGYAIQDHIIEPILNKLKKK